MATSLAQVKSSPSEQRSEAPRLLSLDVFRGATIAAMILVNNPGSDFAYAPLKHSAWNGWTPTDLIFPFFLFIVGLSLTLSFCSRIEGGASKWALLAHSLRRSTIIFLIGLFLNGFPYFHLATWRVAGVLQRIAIVYLAVAVIALHTKWRGLVLWTCALLIGYWLAMRFLPVPGLGMPGRDIPFLDPNGNLDWYLDQRYLPGAMYEKVRDPEGILSTFPAIATALLGVLTGRWLSASRVNTQGTGANLEHPANLVGGMLGLGIALILAGQLWAVWFPINKKLWTSSFVLFTAGCALVCLAICYWITDVKLHRGWTRPLVVFGSNAIAAYVLAEIVSSLLFNLRVHQGQQTFTLAEYLYRAAFPRVAPKALGSLLYSLAFVSLCWLPIYWMYRKRIFLKV